MAQISIAMAQVNPKVGDIDGNTQLVLDWVARACQAGADLVVFPELTLTGYPPEDLLLRPSLAPRIERALERVAQASKEITIVVGYPRLHEQGLHNGAGVFQRGRLQAFYAKQQLPNYQVFDEKRYFTAGSTPCLLAICDIPIALTICEDIWHEQPMRQAAQAGARLMINLNASPYHRGKAQERQTVLARRATEGQMPIVYVNQVGGQDELVFDGCSMAVNADGECVAMAPAYDEHLCLIECQEQDGELVLAGEQDEPLSELASIYQALVIGVRDYVNKNGFAGVVLGLSGGIDSALTLAVAVDALGPERVEAVMMPFRWTSQMSVDDASEQARRQGVLYRSISIESMYESFIAALADEFAGLDADKTEENLQARCRGVLLMAISNKKGYLVLTTGNKSELAVGYSTLYGDMAGGFDVLKDVPKSIVFALARYRNSGDGGEVIPQRVIDRPPSAELAPGQEDQDTLPPYDELDQILELYVERDFSAEAIAAQGFDRQVVNRVLRMVDINEYKRRQSPVGVRITQRGFGRDRRYPITNGWPIGD